MCWSNAPLDATRICGFVQLTHLKVVIIARTPLQGLVLHRNAAKLALHFIYAHNDFALLNRRTSGYWSDSHTRRTSNKLPY